MVNLKAAVKEIKGVAKKDHVTAGIGIVKLARKIWPAFQDIDGSSGSLGSAVCCALEDELVPLMISLDVEMSIRRKWLEQLKEALDDDGVDYLYPFRERWGELCGYPELANEWINQTRQEVQQVYARNRMTGEFVYSPLDTMCFSCLLFTGRYEELRELLSLKPYKVWHSEKYHAMALVKQGRIDEAIAYAESISESDDGTFDLSVKHFCEQALLDAGRPEEAYRRYGLQALEGNTYLNQFRSIVRKYPTIDQRQILQDLIKATPMPSAWFSAARQAGYLDLAIKCAQSGNVDHSTLIRAGRDFQKKEPRFALAVSMRALELIIGGMYYEITVREMIEAYGVAAHSAADIGCLDVVDNSLKKWMAQATPMDEVLRKHLEQEMSVARIA